MRSSARATTSLPRRAGAEVRARLAVAARTGVPVAEALARRDPAVPEEDD
ncbi:hypothetical protein ACH4K7_15615 [Streptomyces globisporus]